MKGNEDALAHWIYTLSKWRHKEKWTHLQDLLQPFAFEKKKKKRNCDGVEKSFRVTVEPLAMSFKTRNSLLIISLLSL